MSLEFRAEKSSVAIFQKPRHRSIRQRYDHETDELSHPKVWRDAVGLNKTHSTCYRMAPVIVIMTLQMIFKYC